VVQGQAQLLEVVLALDALGRRAHLLHRRQQQPNKDGDDGDYHQQLNEREAPGAGCTELHEATSSTRDKQERKGRNPSGSAPGSGRYLSSSMFTSLAPGWTSLSVTVSRLQRAGLVSSSATLTRCLPTRAPSKLRNVLST